jgi:hypothetical protein
MITIQEVGQRLGEHLKPFVDGKKKGKFKVIKQMVDISVMSREPEWVKKAKKS